MANESVANLLFRISTDSTAAQADLNALVNCEGWRGVFTNDFARNVRQNQQLLGQWVTSTHQSLLMVRVAVESLDEMSQRAFARFGQAMGSNIAQAIVYQKSIGAAMQAAVASTLESIAAQAFVQAIYSTALGFLRLAEWDFAGAAAAFEAAGMFGAVGGAAAVAGRAVAPSPSNASPSSASSASPADHSPQSTQSPQSPHVAIYVQGHVIGASGIEELTDMINDAVKNRDVRLIATQTRQTTQAVR